MIPPAELTAFSFIGEPGDYYFYWYNPNKNDKFFTAIYLDEINDNDNITKYCTRFYVGFCCDILNNNIGIIEDTGNNSYIFHKNLGTIGHFTSKIIKGVTIGELKQQLNNFNLNVKVLYY